MVNRPDVLYVSHVGNSGTVVDDFGEGKPRRDFYRTVPSKGFQYLNRSFDFEDVEDIAWM